MQMFFIFVNDAELVFYEHVDPLVIPKVDWVDCEEVEDSLIV